MPRRCSCPRRSARYQPPLGVRPNRKSHRTQREPRPMRSPQRTSARRANPAACVASANQRTRRLTWCSSGTLSPRSVSGGMWAPPMATTYQQRSPPAIRFSARGRAPPRRGLQPGRLMQSTKCDARAEHQAKQRDRLRSDLVLSPGSVPRARSGGGRHQTLTVR